MEVWEKFGGRSEYLKAPKSLVDKVRLIITAQYIVRGEQAEEDKKKQAELDAQLRVVRAQQE